MLVSPEKHQLRYENVPDSTVHHTIHSMQLQVVLGFSSILWLIFCFDNNLLPHPFYRAVHCIGFSIMLIIHVSCFDL